MIEALTQYLVHTDADPITDILNKDWAAVGGWTLAIIVIMINLLGFLTGQVVPGWMYRRISNILDKAMDQNRSLLAAAEITKHFFESTAPKRRTQRKVSEVKHAPQKEDSKDREGKVSSTVNE